MTLFGTTKKAKLAFSCRTNTGLTLTLFSSHRLPLYLFIRRKEEEEGETCSMTRNILQLLRTKNEKKRTTFKWEMQHYSLTVFQQGIRKQPLKVLAREEEGGGAFPHTHTRCNKLRKKGVRACTGYIYMNPPLLAAVLGFEANYPGCTRGTYCYSAEEGGGGEKRAENLYKTAAAACVSLTRCRIMMA